MGPMFKQKNKYMIFICENIKKDMQYQKLCVKISIDDYEFRWCIRCKRYFHEWDPCLNRKINMWYSFVKILKKNM